MMQMHTNTPSWPAAAYQASVLKPSVSFHASHELHMLLSTYRQQSLHIAEDAPLGMTSCMITPNTLGKDGFLQARSPLNVDSDNGTSHVLMHMAA